MRGTYSTIAQRLPQPGVYDLTLLLDSPRVAHCFALDAGAGSACVDAAAATLEPVTLPQRTRAGGQLESTPERFGADAIGGAAIAKADAVAWSGVATALVILSPGAVVPSAVADGLAADDGTWRLEFTPPRAGIYLLAFDAPDLGLDVESGAGAFHTIEATDRAAAGNRDSE